MTAISKIAIAGSALLALSACETAGELIGGDTARAELTGAQVRPGGGDPDGVGSAEITVVQATNKICYDVEVSNIAAPTAAHLHRGGPAAGHGTPVFELETPSDGGAQGCKDAPEALRDQVRAMPGAYYVDVHNAEFPRGALRGQLGRN